MEEPEEPKKYVNTLTQPGTTQLASVRGRPMQRSAAFWERVRGKILANETLSRENKHSNRQLAVELGVQVRHILEERRRLIAKGVIVKTPGFGRVPDAKKSANPAMREHSLSHKEAQSLLEQVEGGKIFDRSEKIAILSRIMAYGADASKMRAIEVSDALERGSEEKSGYKRPGNYDAMLRSLMRILRAAGRSGVQHAISIVEQEGWDASGAQEEQDDTSTEGNGPTNSPVDLG